MEAKGDGRQDQKGDTQQRKRVATEGGDCCLYRVILHLLKKLEHRKADVTVTEADSL